MVRLCGEVVGDVEEGVVLEEELNVQIRHLRLGFRVWGLGLMVQHHALDCLIDQANQVKRL